MLKLFKADVKKTMKNSRSSITAGNECESESAGLNERRFTIRGHLPGMCRNVPTVLTDTTNTSMNRQIHKSISIPSKFHLK